MMPLEQFSTTQNEWRNLSQIICETRHSDFMNIGFNDFNKVLTKFSLL